MATERKFIPALRFDALTPIFDRFVNLTSHERRFKSALLDAAAIAPGESVLDVGSGTGTLALEVAARVPDARVTGLDPDPAILERARDKAAGTPNVEFVAGFSDDLPFADDSFDVVLSTLVFHHMHRPVKVATFAELMRVLKPGGRLHVADWHKPDDLLMKVAFNAVRGLDGYAVTSDNARGLLPRLFADAGFREVAVGRTFRTPIGLVALFSATR